MSAEQQKAKGNACFRRNDYDAAAEYYSSGLNLLENSSPASTAPLRLALLANRSLALHRLGRYAAAAADAEAALQLDPSSSKAAFRAAAARLMMGGGAAAAQHAQALVKDGSPSAQTNSGAAASQPAIWAALARHAAALAEHQRQLAAAETLAAAGPEVGELLEALAAEAEGEGEAAGGPAALLQRLAALLGAGGRQGEAGCAGSSTSSISSSSTSSTSSAEKAAVALEAHPQGFRLLLFFLADPDPAVQQAAAAALQAAAHAAAGGSAATVLWPAHVWQRLAALGTDAGGGEVQQCALRLLSWAAGQDTWVREQLLLHPLPAPGSSTDVSAALSGSPAIVPQVAGLLAEPATLHSMAPAAVQAAAGLLQQYATDAAAAEALAQLSCQPLLALLRAAREAEGMAAFQPPDQAAAAADAAAAGDNTQAYAPNRDGSPAQSGSSNGIKYSSKAVDPEQEALEALRSKLRKVYIADLVALQRCLLAAACQLAAASRELLLDEAVVEQGSGGTGGKRGVGAGPFLAELLELVRELHGRQPRRTAPVLGPDGNPKAYAKRRFAADFKDNPAGDFLLSMDLQQGGRSAGLLGDCSQSNTGGSSGTTAKLSQPAQPTLLELCLALLLHTACASPTTAALLHRRDVLGLCEELASYCTPAVVTAAQQLVAAVADRVPAAAEEIVQGGHVPALAALLLHSTSEVHRQQALDKLAGLADMCSGDDFAALTATAPGATAAEARACAVHAAWQLLGSAEGSPKAAPKAMGAKEPAAAAAADSNLPRLARRFLLRCCERSQRQQRLGQPQAPPRGGCWDAISRPRLQELLQSEAAQPAKQGAQPEEEGASFSQLKRGFFGSKQPQKPASAMPTLPPRRAAPSAGGSGSSNQAVPAAAQPRSQGGSQGSHGSSAAASGETHAYKQGAVVIEELEPEPAAPSVATAATRPAQPASSPPKPARVASEQATVVREQQAAAAAEQQAAVQEQEEAVAAAASAEQEAAAAATAAEQEALLAYRLQQEQAAATKQEEDEEDIADLQDVYDSSTSLAAEQRQVRAEWISLPMERKLRWTQTSLDVSVHVLLPPGTRASDVQVATTPDRLTISLKWYGRVLDGQLHLRVKPSETHWCLEDREAHVLLAKAEADAWWKKLMEGGEERGYYELLKEAVNADEPVKPFDQLDDESKRLLDAIQERQAYIQAGLIDPEGFDDFRVVIGESGLRPSQAHN